MQQAVAQFQRPGQGACAGRAQAGQRGQFGRGAFQQGTQRAMLGEQFARRGDGVAPVQARAQEDRQQFGVAEAAGTPRQQLFAGTFFVGLVADVHGRTVANA